MANDSGSTLSSAFDALLDKSRREWDALAPGSPLGAAGRGPADAATVRPAPPIRPAGAAPARAAPGEVLRRTGEHASAARVWDPAKSEAAAFLFNRFGSDWRIEVAERRRDGDEFSVLVKLTVPDKNLVKSQFGRGKIPAHEGERPLSGSAGGVAFSLGGESAGPGQSPEERGYRRAIENALAKCVELL